jgi:hypothetical protein
VADVNRRTKERIAARKRWRAQMQSPGFREAYQAHQREFAYKATWRIIAYRDATKPIAFNPYDGRALFGGRP